MSIKVGSRVRIVDGSEANGDLGVVLYIQNNGIIVVELDQGCVWPITEERELEEVDSEP